jgi:protein-disulfide isomerase
VIRKYGLLAALIVMGLLLSVMLRLDRDVGTDVSGSPLAASILKDSSSPTAAARGADLTLVVFTDYQCPACRRSDPEMRRAVQRDGRIRLIYKDWPILGERSRQAARVALASDSQGIYSEVHRNLMAAPDLGANGLRRAVEAAGGDWEQIEAELARNPERYDRQLAFNASQAFGLGLAGTPGYLIGPILVRGGLSERQFLRVFEEARP